MDHIVHALKGSLQPVLVPHVADEVPHHGIIFLQLILHHELLVLISGIDDDLLRLVVLQHVSGKALSKGARSARDQYGLII